MRLGSEFGPRRSPSAVGRVPELGPPIRRADEDPADRGNRLASRGSGSMAKRREDRRRWRIVVGCGSSSRRARVFGVQRRADRPAKDRRRSADADRTGARRHRRRESREAMRDLLREAAEERVGDERRGRQAWAGERREDTRSRKRSGSRPGRLCAGESAADASRARASLSHRLPARSRSDRARARVPAPRVQDPGLRPPRERPLPESTDAYDRGGTGRAHDRPDAAPERRPRRGDRARPRPRPHALRPRGRARSSTS